MATTRKTILVKNQSIREVIDASKTHLSSKGFRIQDTNNNLICTRGSGLLTSQQRFILKFTQKDESSIQIDGEFFTLSYYFLKSTVDEKAISGAIPRRKGYKLMEEYISSIDETVA
ncbi:MAG: hypothetical protein ABUK01_09945 [Leptospirales bacterium]